MSVQNIRFGIMGVEWPSDNALNVQHVKTTQGINQIPEIQLELNINGGVEDLNLQTWTGRQGVLIATPNSCACDDSGTNSFVIAGIVHSVQVSTASTISKVRLKVSAWPSQPGSFYFVRNYQLFKNQTSLEIAQQIFESAGGKFINHSNAKLEKRHCEIQYGESDQQFVSRILAEDKLIFNIRTDYNANELPQSAVPIQMSIYKSFMEFEEASLVLENLNTNTDSVGSENGIYNLQTNYQQGLQKIISNSTRKPPEVLNLIVESKETSNDIQNWIDVLPDEKYLTRQEGVDNAELIRKSSSNVEYQFNSQILNIASGFRYKLNFNDCTCGDDDDDNDDAMIAVTSIGHEFTFNVIGDWATELSLNALDQSALFAPPKVKRPELPGLLYGRIVKTNTDPNYSEKSDDKTVHTTAISKVKVRISWPGDVKNNSNFSEIWLRMMTPWAGHNAGFLAPPRVGQEVIVSFVNGDANQPIVLGCLYGKDKETGSQPPWDPSTDLNWVGIGTRSKADTHQRIRLRADEEDPAVEIQSAGPLDVYASGESNYKSKNKLNIESETADVNITSGNDIDLEANNDLILHGKVNAFMRAANHIDISASSVTITGLGDDWVSSTSKKITGASMDITGTALNITGVSTDITGTAFSSRLMQLATSGVSINLSGLSMNAAAFSFHVGGIGLSYLALDLKG